MAAVILHCTCPDAATAARIAEHLVQARLAACVQQVPGLRSTYRWQGRLETADEVLLLIKTVRERMDDAIAVVRAMHPYELPEVLAIEACGGTPDYLAWLTAQTRRDA